MNWYLSVLKKYAVFSGRSRRKEYWMFELFNTIVFLILGNPFALTGFDVTGIYTIAVMIPTIAVVIRRAHDVGKSGWFMLIPIYNLILLCTEGVKGDNKYGADPKADSLNIQAP